MTRATFILATSLALISITARGHHGDAGRYEDMITTLSGVVVAVQIVNPHSSLVLDVKAEDGQVVRWQVQVSNAVSLTRLGWTRGTLRPGDAIMVSGRGVKSGTPYMDLSERSRLLKLETCEEIFHSGMTTGTAPDYPPLACAR